MALKWKCGIGLSTILISSFVIAEVAQEISCRAIIKKDLQHIAKITMADGRIKSFSYVSARTNGHTCEVIGSRQDTESSWVDEENKRTFVSLFFGKQEIAKVLLKNADPEFTIKILTPITSVCGLKGYIAKTVVITAHKKTCILQD